MPTAVTQNEVVDVALRLLRGGGVDAISMRRLAEEVGASYQVVYSRIGGKAEVVRAMHDRGFEDLVTASLQLDTTPGTREHVVAGAVAYLDWAREHPELFELMFASPVPEFRRDDAALAVEWEAFRACWLAAVGTWLDEQFDERPPRTALRLAWRLWTAVHGITVVDLAGHAAPSGDAEVEVTAMVDLLLADPLAAAAGPIGDVTAAGGRLR